MGSAVGGMDDKRAAQAKRKVTVARVYLHGGGLKTPDMIERHVIFCTPALHLGGETPKDWWT